MVRVSFCVAACALACTLQTNAQPAIPWPTTEWAVQVPENVGLLSAPFEKLHQDVLSGTYGNIDRILVVRRGYLVVDRYYDRDYETISAGHVGALGCGYESCDGGREADPYNYYHPSSHPYFRGRDVHSLQSITKSIAALVVGTAIMRGKIDSLDAPLLSFFSEYDDVNPRLRSATLRHLLTMQTGIEWHEQDRPLDETNTTLQLERSEDWIRFTLEQPMDAAPGEKWAYNSGGSHLMSGVVHHATGVTIDMWADEHLFRPLGIRDWHWKTTPTGLPDTEGGLYLEAADLAKIGYLVLREGMWNGEPILDRSFVHAATARQIESVNRRGWGYGFHIPNVYSF